MLIEFKSVLLKPHLWIDAPYNPFTTRLPFSTIKLGEFCCGNGHFAEGIEQPNYIIIYTVSGSATLKYRSKKHILTSGTLVILNLFEYHNYKNESDQPWIFRRITFNGEHSSIFDDLINGSDLQIINFDETYFNEIFQNLIYCLEKNTISSVVNTSANIMNLLSKCVEQSKNDRFGLSKDINEVIEYIYLNFGEKIILDDLARVANTSKYNLIRRFKKQMNITPYEYILQYRLTKARHLLMNTDKSIGEIAEDIGIFDESSFIKQFRNYTGFTPNKFKKEHKNFL